MAKRMDSSRVASLVAVALLLAAACEARPLLRGKPAPGSDDAGAQQQRTLLSEKSRHASARAARHQHAGDAVSASGVPSVLPSVGGVLPGVGAALPGVGAGIGAGVGAGAGWLNTAGLVVSGIDYGVGVGTQLLAPLVNGIASNVPLMVPALPGGQCLRGTPVPIPQANTVMCVVGSGAQVTNYLFNAANVLVGAAGRAVNVAGQFGR